MIVCLFLQHTSHDGTISQFKSPSAKLLADLLSFVSKQDDEDDEEGETTLLDKIRVNCQSSQKVGQESVDKMYSELNRAFRMFYLQQQMTGKLKEHKDDYFV